MTKITLLKFGYENNVTPFFVAFSIIVSYNFIRFYEIKTDRLSWFKKWFFENKKKILFLSISSTLVLVYILFFEKNNWNSFIILFPFLFMTIFYVIPLFKIGEYEISFRNFPGIKIFSIAVAWAGISVLFPLYDVGEKFTENVYLEFFQRILILIVITLPFDIRDVRSDSKELKTLPAFFGVKKAKFIGFMLLFIFVLLEFLKENTSLITFGIAIVTGLFLWFSSSNKPRFYTSFWVESVPILWLLLIMLFL